MYSKSYKETQPQFRSESFQEPLVSVVTPTYNRSKYLEQALRSSIQQTYQNIEIIVFDNCSDNNPKQIIESFNDSRIRFFRQDCNVGAFKNVMSAFSKAQGKYIACLLDDDLWEKDYLSTMIPILERKSDIVLAFCDHYMMDGDGEIDLKKTEECSKFYKRDSLSEGSYKSFWDLAIVSQSISPAFSAIMRRDAIDWNAIPPEVGLLWDTYIAYLYSMTNGSAYYFPSRLTRCREHSQTITQQSGSQNITLKLSKAESEIFCCKTYLSDSKLVGLYSYFRKKLAHHLTTSAVALMRLNKKREAKERLLSSFRIYPNLRTLGVLTFYFMPETVFLFFYKRVKILF